MKKTVLIFVFSLLIPMSAGIFTSSALALSDEPAVGDPLTPGWKRPGRKPVKKKVEETSPEQPAAATPAAEPAKPTEPAKPAEPAKY